jgi:hypothetical protein
MTQVLKKSTAIKVRVGPFVQQDDGVTAVNSATVVSSDVAYLLKANGSAVSSISASLSAITSADGWYSLGLTATGTDTVGTLETVFMDADKYLPVHARFQVVTSAAYDGIYGTTSTLLTSQDVGLLYEATVSAVTSQTSLKMASNISTNDVWNGNLMTVEDVTTGEMASARITDVVAADDQIDFTPAPVFTIAANDVVRVFREVHPLAALNEYDPPTRAELTTDKNSILDRLLAFFQLALRSDSAIATDRSSELGLINTDEGTGAGDYDNTTDSQEHGNVQNINNTAVTGAGTSGDLWRGA